MFEAAGALGTEFAFIKTAAEDYLRWIRARAPADVTRITDKMPFNFVWAGLIHLVFPRATIIHCQRRPIDTALSIHQTHFSPLIDFPTGGKDLVFYYREYERVMAHWRRVLPPDRLLELRYEQLIADLEAITRRLIAFCGLPWGRRPPPPGTQPARRKDRQQMAGAPAGVSQFGGALAEV